VKSTRAAIRPHRRLPVCPEPHPDEDWCGYLDRLAVALECTTRELRQHLGLGPHGDTWVPSHRDHGITMTTATAARLGGLLDLDPVALISMQLQRYDGRLLTFTVDDVEQLDPTPSPDGVEYVGRGLHRVGLVELRPRLRACPACHTEQPDLWRLSWRLLWTVACERHRLLITSPDAPPTPADQDAISAQRAVAALAATGEPHGRGLEIVRDLSAAIELHHRAGGTRRGPSWPAPAQMAAYLPSVLRWATGPASARDPVPGAVQAWISRSEQASVADRHALTSDSPVRAAIAQARGTRAPSRPVVLARDLMPTRPLTLASALRCRLPAAIPQTIPLDLYVGDLSDLLYPTALRAGRSVAALACVVLATGLAPPRAAHQFALPLRSRQFTDVWGRLLEQGCLEAAWDAIADVTEQLARRGVDYVERRRLAAAPDTAECITGITGPIPGRILRRWLGEYWAGQVADLPSGRNANGREQRALARFDVEHGDVLRVALENLATTRRAVS